FWVGPFPCLDGMEGNNGVESAQLIEMNTTIGGIILNEEVDYYALNLKEGCLLGVEIEAMRLGAQFFDPYLALLDVNGVEVVKCDDTPLLMQDSYLSFRVPTD